MARTLRPDMTLGKDEAAGYATLSKRRNGSEFRPEFRLHPFQGFVLSLFDGRRSDAEVVDTAAAVLEANGGAPDAARGRIHGVVDALISRYRQFLVEHDGTAPAEPELSPADFLFTTSYNFNKVRSAAPAALLWVVTEYCNRKCSYCYKDAIFTEDVDPADMDLSLERVRELAREAADVGVTLLILSGGEPFLRSDLVEVIDAFLKNGVDVLPITKSRIGDEKMRALRATGLKELHVSLDSHRPEMVAELTGVDSAFSDMVDTIRTAKRYGQPVVLRPCLTSRNLREFEELVDFAHELGVEEVLADLYTENCNSSGRYDPSLKSPREDAAWLRERLPAVAERYPDMTVTFKFEDDESQLSFREVRGGEGCVEGLRGLTFLPDGRVVKCEHWPGDDLVFGDLRGQSLMEIWESESLLEINCAPRESFAGSPCYRCKKFDDCSEVRGRCSMSSLERFGTVHAPDVYCPIGAYEKSRPRSRQKSELPVIDQPQACA